MPRSVRPLPRRPQVVLLTGVTGFVGQAVLERFLRAEAEVHVVIRSRPDAPAASRLDSLLLRSAFDAWRAEVGPAGVARARARLHVVDADLTHGVPHLPDGLDLVVHSASSVSFDEPWDSAVRTNVLGPRNLYEALHARHATPHVVHVSTSYVGTDRTDLSAEEPVAHDVDWRAEVAAVDAARVDLRSGTLRAADRDAADAIMKERGRARAHELGWTDVYTMTKSLGERVAEELWGQAGNPLTILRPTIIESALHRPHPGWLDGFKVADPLIAAFAKGRLVAFPGHPDAVIDIVPVDVVVDAIMAAGHLPPEGSSPRYLQVGTGVSNPITLDDFRRHIERQVHAHPWTDREGRHVHPRPWRFLSPHELDGWASRRARTLTWAGRVLDRVPGGTATRTRRRVDVALRSLGLLRTYVGIYQPYSCSRTVYDDRNTRALLAQARDHGVEGALDVTAIDWEHYLTDVHMPGLTRVAEDHRRRSTERRLAAAGQSIPPRGRRSANPQVSYASAGA